MKGKAKIKTVGQSSLARRVVFLIVILLAAIKSSCFYAPVVIPPELTGTYRTTHRDYEDQFFELGSRIVTMGFSGSLYKFYSVKKIQKEIIDNRTLYTILCANEDSEEEFNFAFFVDFAGEVIIHFKNKPKVAWKKHLAGVYYNDNFFRQIRH